MNSFLRIAGRPAKGLGVPVVELNVAHDLVDQVGYRTEDATADAIASDHTQPDPDLVEPGGVGWSEMEPNVRMALESSLDQGCLVNREVVQDHMGRFPPVSGHGFVEKPHKFRARRLQGTISPDFPAVHLESAKQSRMCHLFM